MAITRPADAKSVSAAGNPQTEHGPSAAKAAPKSVQPQLPLNPILAPLPVAAAGAGQGTASARQAQDGEQAEPSPLAGLRPRRPPAPDGGESITAVPTRPGVVGSIQADIQHRELKLDFSEEAAPADNPDDLGIGD